MIQFTGKDLSRAAIALVLGLLFIDFTHRPIASEAATQPSVIRVMMIWIGI
ncbi:MAG: hypothetical protein RMM98_08115 [Acidobacteriota bacterium]|nr:hypothetical protein [Blastocatellia bacterium]MDW8239565.1 hypothetical protein [Acidobacteriota bacterium]